MVRAHNHQVAEAERPGEIVVRWTARQVPALLVLAVTGAISLYAGSALAQDPEVEEKTEAGFPDEFTIEFDESHDWIRLTAGSGSEATSTGCATRTSSLTGSVTSQFALCESWTEAVLANERSCEIQGDGADVQMGDPNALQSVPQLDIVS
jgi:hypothetical protein